jgi:hypothetical protein
MNLKKKGSVYEIKYIFQKLVFFEDWLLSDLLQYTQPEDL